MARHDKSKSRVTPKGTTPVNPTAGHEPVHIDPPSPTWVPVANYTIEVLGMPSNWYLLGGLGMVLAGIITATQYR